jgi:AcrR family transcriptional regulator
MGTIVLYALPMPKTRSGETRQWILERAMDLASVEGLEGVSIGRLAQSLEMSKSGVIGHFASKQDLQLATVEAARRRFETEVVDGLRAEPGIERLRAMAERWICYVEGEHFSGGCFFWAASAEFDGRPGPVRDRLAELTASWLDSIEAEARLAQRLAEIVDSEDPAQLAFELHAYVQEANWAFQLLRRSDAFMRARRAVADRIARASGGSAASEQ